MKKNIQKRPLSGEQYQLNFTDSKGRKHVASIVSLGCSLREYSVDGLDVVVPFSEDSLPPHFSGSALLPFPNRLGEGSYVFEGKEYQLSINEIVRNNQLHALSSGYSFCLVEKTDQSVTLGCRIPAQRGYPFDIYTEITYILGEDGLTISSETQNMSQTNAPFSLGWHPWFSTRGDQSKAQISLDANSFVDVNERLLPTGEKSVDGSKFDIRNLTSMDNLEFDDAWVDVKLEDGFSKAVLVGADGHKTTVIADENYKAWQICSAAGFTDPKETKFGIAIEPMTAYANAFKTGRYLTVLKPYGESGSKLETKWQIRFE